MYASGTRPKDQEQVEIAQKAMEERKVEFRLGIGNLKPYEVTVEISRNTTAGVKKVSEFKLTIQEDNKRIWKTSVDLPGGDLLYAYSLRIRSLSKAAKHPMNTLVTLSVSELSQENIVRHITPFVKTYRDNFRGSKDKNSKYLHETQFHYLQDIFSDVSGLSLDMFERSLSELRQAEIIATDLQGNPKQIETLIDWVRMKFWTRENNQILFLGVVMNSICKLTGKDITDLQLDRSSLQRLGDMIKSFPVNTLSKQSLTSFYELTVMLLNHFHIHHWLYMAIEYPNIFKSIDRCTKDEISCELPSDTDFFLKELGRVYKDDIDTLRQIITQLPAKHFTNEQKNRLWKEHIIKDDDDKSGPTSREGESTASHLPAEGDEIYYLCDEDENKLYVDAVSETKTSLKMDESCDILPEAASSTTSQPSDRHIELKYPPENTDHYNDITPVSEPQLGGAVTFHLLTKVGNIDAIYLCIFDRNAKKKSQHLMSTNPYSQSIFCKENWTFASLNYTLPVDEVCQYRYAIKLKSGTFSSSSFIEEGTILKLVTPIETVRKVFVNPKDRLSVQQTTVDKGNLLFVDMLLPEVTTENLERTLKIVEDLEFLTTLESLCIRAQRKILQWIETVVSKSNQCDVSVARLQYIVVMLSKLFHSEYNPYGTCWKFSGENRQKRDSPLTNGSAFLLLQVIPSLHRTHSEPRIPKPTLALLSTWLVNHVNGTWLQLFHYFYPILDANMLNTQLSRVQQPPIDFELWKQWEPVIVQLCENSTPQNNAEALIFTLIPQITHVDVLIAFAAICNTGNFAERQLKQAVEKATLQLIQSKQFSDLLAIWHKTNDKTIRGVLERQVIKKLTEQNRMSSDADTAAIRTFILLPDLYHCEEDVVEVMRRLLQPHRQAIVDDIHNVFFNIVQSHQIMSLLSEGKQHELFKAGINFMKPNAPFTSQNIPKLCKLYRLLNIVHSGEPFRNQFCLYNKCSELVFGCQVSLKILFDCLKASDTGLTEFERKFVSEHMIYIFRDSVKFKEKKLLQIKEIWKTYGGIQIDDELDLGVWQACADMIGVPVWSADILSEDCMTERGESCVRSIIKNIDVWLTIFSATGNHSKTFVGHENCQIVVRILKYISSKLETGQISFLIFTYVLQKRGMLSDLFGNIDQYHNGIASSWKSAFDLCNSTLENCRFKLVVLRSFYWFIWKVSFKYKIGGLEQFDTEIKQKEKETNNKSTQFLYRTLKKEFWGSLYILSSTAIATSAVHKSKIFLNICRLVLKETRNTFTDLADFATWIHQACLQRFVTYCNDLFKDDTEIKASVVKDMLTGIKDLSSLVDELVILSKFCGKDLHEESVEALENFVGLDDLRTKSGKLQRVFEIFNITDTTEAIPNALDLLSNLSDNISQQTLSLSDLNVAMKSIVWIARQFEDEDWGIIDKLAHCNELIEFLRTIFTNNEDLRNLVAAVEVHSEQNVNEGTITDLIDVQQYVQPLMALSNSDKAEHFVNTIKENKTLRGDLCEKIENCSRNVHCLKDLHDNVSNQEEVTKEIVRNALEKGSYRFTTGNDDENCSTVMSFGSSNGQKTYNLDDLNDVRSQALLIVNSEQTTAARAQERVPTGFEKLRKFIDTVALVNNITHLLNLLHETGHFEYGHFKLKKNANDLVALCTELEETHEKWLDILCYVRQKHYYLNFFHSQQLWILDKFFHDNENASIEVEQLLQFVDKTFTLNDSIRRYYYKPKESKDMKLRLDSLGAALSSIFPEERIELQKFPFLPENNSLENVVQSGKLFVAELEQQSSQSIPVLLELYRNTTGFFPEASQVLFCHMETTTEELDLLLQRCKGSAARGQLNALFCVANVELLSTEAQSYLVDEIDVIRKNEDDFLLAIICRGNSNHQLIDHFSREHSVRIHGMNDTDIERSFYSKWKHVEVITSALPGMGKSEYIFNKATDQNFDVVTIPISGPITKESLVKDFRQHTEHANCILHVDVNMVSDPDLLDTFLFEVIVLGRVTDRNHVFSLQTDHIALEIANTSQNKLRNSLPTCRCFRRQSLHWKNFDDYITSNELHSPVQVACHYLKAQAESTLNACDIVFSGPAAVTPLSNKKCRELLRQHFKDTPRHELSYTVVQTFLIIFASELQRLSSSVFFAVENLPHSVDEESCKDLRNNLTNALSHIAKDFSARAAKMEGCEENTSIKLSKFYAGNEVTAEHMAARVKHMITWENSNHLLLLFNRHDPQTISLLYRSLEQVPQSIRRLFKLQLKKDLPNYQTFKQKDLHQLLELVCRHQKHEFDIDKLKELKENYALTPDNVLKMILIHLRIKSGIPVIIMGETGCGKTTLITYLARVCEVPFFHYHIHAGTTKEDILAEVSKLREEAEKDMRRNKKETWAFFDEINTCDHLGLLNEIIIHHKCQGVPLPRNLIFMAACNPYRLRPIESKLSTAGLSGKIVDDEQSKLVYRVHPLPEGLMEFVWDYGSLHRNDEAGYILRMMEGVTEFGKEFSKLLVMSQEFIRRVEQNQYCVSLRDVQRVKHLVRFFMDDFFPMKSMAEVAHNLNFNIRGIDAELEIRAWILALAHCYHARLEEDEDRRKYRKKMAEVLKELIPNVTEKYIDDVIRDEQMDILNKMQLPEGTAKNLALRENVFVILVCILNKLPVFLVGKPGCSKSLSMQMIVSNIRGPDSESDFFKKLPIVIPIPYQGSESSTSDGIKKVFNKAERTRHKRSNSTPVVLLDEIGLAEISRFNPLKVLHSLLEPTVGDFSSVAVVGISNWALDAAKMNRAIHLSRPDPTVKDLYETAKSIRDDVDTHDQGLATDEMLQHLAEAYFEYVKRQKPQNFHGLRDYYSMVKYITCISSSDGEESVGSDSRIDRGLSRNFGGLRKTDFNCMMNIFREKILLHPEPEGEVSVLDMIRHNLNDKIARHLMIITSGDSALAILEQALQGREHKVMFGSRFEDDCSEEYNYKILSDIILAMKCGITLVLKDLESIYGCLYDMLNQNYTYSGLKRKCRIAHGPYRSPYCEVHENFRCIVLIAEHKISLSDPPFLNRFEKQMLKFADIISESVVLTKAVTILRQWLDDIASVKGTAFRPGHMFIGLHCDTLQSVVYQQAVRLKDGSPTAETIAQCCKKKLIKTVCPDAALRSSKSKLAHEQPHEIEQFHKDYLGLPLHDGLKGYLYSSYKTINDETCLKDVVYTHSNIHTDLRECLEDLSQTIIHKLGHIRSEHQLETLLRRFWRDRDDKLLILQCNSKGDASKILLVKCLIDQQCKEYVDACENQNKKLLKHVCIIVHVDRGERQSEDLQPTWQFNFLSGWRQVTIDDLGTCTPSFDILVRHSIRQLIANKHIEVTTLAKDQILWSITCLRYIIQQRDPESCLELTQNLTNSPEFLNLLQPHILKSIKEDSSDDDRSEEEGIQSNSWQVEVACNKEQLGTRAPFSTALTGHIRESVRRPIGKTIFFLEKNCAWNGCPLQEQPQDETAVFWKVCFNSENLFDINDKTIPEPRGLETCVIDTQRQAFMFPFFRVFHEKIESNKGLFVKEAATMANEQQTSITDEHIFNAIAGHVVRMIQNTVPEFEFHNYLANHIDAFFQDFSVQLAVATSINVNEEGYLPLAQWLLNHKISLPPSASPLEKVAQWYTRLWLEEYLIANELQFLMMYKNTSGRSVDDILCSIEDELQENPEEEAGVRKIQNLEEVDRDTYFDDNGDDTDDNPTNNATPPTLEDVIIKVACRSILPLKEHLDKLGGVKNWQRKTSLLLLHAGKISAVPHQLHFLRLCRDFVAVLSPHFELEADTLAQLAELGNCESDALAKHEVFYFIWSQITNLMENDVDGKSSTQLQELLCMFFVRALEANPDTPMLEQILSKLTTHEGLPIAGARPVLYRIIKADIEDYELTEEESPSCETIIKTGMISDDFPNLQLLNNILEEQSNSNLAVIICDILEDFAFDYVTVDRILKIKSREDATLEVVNVSGDVLHRSTMCNLQTVCAAAFVRAFFRSAAEVLKNVKTSDVDSNTALRTIVDEVNNLISLTEDDEVLGTTISGCLRVYMLKMLRSMFSLYSLRNRSIQLERLTAFKDLPWQVDLFKASKLVYNPICYVQRYEEVIQAVAEWQMKDNPSNIIKVMKRAKSDESYRLGLLAVIAERFYFLRSINSLKDTDKEQAKWLLEVEETKELEPDFLALLKHLSGFQEFPGILQLNDTTEMDHVEQVAVVVHVSCVVFSSQVPGLQQYLRLTESFREMFVPGRGKLTSVLDEFQSTIPSWQVECPSCENHMVGKLPQRASTVCTSCNATIKKDIIETTPHRLHGDVQTMYDTTTGYSRLTSNSSANSDLSVRALTPVAYRAFNIILHSCFLMGFATGLTKADDLIDSLDCNDDFVREGSMEINSFLWQKIQEDWCVLQELLQFKCDKTALFLHSCLAKSADILKTCGEASLDPGKRDLFERQWSDIVDKEVRSLTESVNIFKTNVFACLGSKDNSLEHKIDELSIKADFDDNEETADYDDEEETADSDDKVETADSDDEEEIADSDDKEETADSDVEEETADSDDKEETTDSDDKEETADSDDKEETADSDDKEETADSDDKEETADSDDKEETADSDDKEDVSISKLFRRRTTASFSHFRASVINHMKSFTDEYMFLRLFLSKEKSLHCLRCLQELLEWNRFVSDSLIRLRIERRDGSRTIEDFMSRSDICSSEAERNDVTHKFHQFESAWNIIRDNWRLLTGRDPHPNFVCMSLDRPIYMCVIDAKDDRNPFRLIIETLIDIQNNFLYNTLCIASSGLSPTLTFLLRDDHIAALPTVSLDDANKVMINHTWDDHRYLICCDVDTRYGKGTTIQYNFTAIERELACDLVLDKAFLSPGQTFNRFSYADELFHACSTILMEVGSLIPQLQLPNDVINTVVDQDTKKPSHSKKLMEHLEVLLLFLKHSGGRPEQPLHSYVKEWSAILPRSFADDLLPRAGDSIKLQHIVSLYETLEDIMADRIVSTLHNAYRKHLDEYIASKLVGECASKNVTEVEKVLSIVKRFVFRYLRSGVETESNSGLVQLMQRTAGRTLICRDVATLIPDDITVGHVVQVLEILKKHVEQRKDVTKKVALRGGKKRTRQSKVLLSRF